MEVRSLSIWENVSKFARLFSNNKTTLFPQHSRRRKRQRRRQQWQQPPKRKVSTTIDVLPTTNTTNEDIPLMPSSDKTNVASVQSADEKVAQLIIIYQDQKHQALADPQIISGQIGDATNIKFRQFAGYTLNKIVGYTANFVHHKAILTLTYEKHDGGIIWQFSRNYDNYRLLTKPQFHKGKLGKPYSLAIPQIPNYVFLKANGKLKGQFTEKQQTVTYFFRRADWVDVTTVSHLLRMESYVTCYDDIGGNTLATPLAKNSVWQTFLSVKMADRSLWHNIGGNIWIKETADITYIHPYDMKPELPLLPVQEVDLYATIDFIAGKELLLFNSPFGKKSSSIKNNEQVRITRFIHLEGINWFYVANEGWTTEYYLHFQ